MSILVSLRGMLRLIRIDTLRRVLNVGFLAGRLIYMNVVDLNQTTRIQELIWIYTDHVTN